MNSDMVVGFLVQCRGRVRRQWARLLLDERAEVRGDRDVLMGALQRYCGRMRSEKGRTTS